MLKQKRQIIFQFAICNPMSNTGNSYRGTLDSDGKLFIKSNMNDWHLVSNNVYTKIDVTSCDSFTGDEINFMIYDICVT